MTSPLLIIGIGNSGRGDDGLGWALLDRLTELNRPDWQLEYRYQLVVEDAELFSHFPAVLIVDASQHLLPDGYRLSVCAPDPEPGLYTHQQTPGGILFLCQQVFGQSPAAHILEIQGYQWSLGSGLSENAVHNLDAAEHRLKTMHTAQLLQKSQHKPR